MSEEIARLYEETQRRLREVTTLYEASQACLSISDQKGLLTAIIEAAARAAGATLGSVMLIDKGKGEYVFGAHYGLSQKTIAAIEAELHIPLGEGLVGSVVTTGQPVVVADVSMDPRWVPTKMKEPVRSFLGVPLMGRDGQPLGALTLSHLEVGAFDEDHARLLSTFANQAALAIENARLYEQAQQEIAERKRAEEVLRASEETAQALLNAPTESAILLDTKGTILAMNEIVAQRLGQSVDELVGLCLYDLFSPSVAKLRKERIEEAIRSGKPVHFEDKRRGRIFDSSIYPVFDAQGKVIRVAVFAQDITERKGAEERLRRERDLVARLMETSPAGITVVNRQGQITFANTQAKQVLGLTIDEITQRTYNAPEWRITDYDGNPFPNEELPFRRVMATGEPVYDVRHAIEWPNGQRVLLSVNAAPLFDESGQVDGMVATVEDITERVRAEEALRESEERYRALFEQANDAVFLETLEGRILDVNERACQLLGYERQELLRLTVADVVPPEIQEMLPQIIQEEIGRGGVRLEAENVRKDGSRVAVEVSTALSEVGGQNLVLTLVRDITERKKLEEQLRQAQKMEAIGTLAGGIAHDFNNILTGILGFASVVHSELPAASPLRPDVEIIIRSAQQASDLTRQLLTFARRDRVEVCPLSLNDIAREVIRLLKHTVDKAIVIESHLARDLSTIEGNVSQLQQMLLNLCLNARDAMPQGGRLIIETQNVTLSEEKTHADLDLEAGQYVLLSVTDTGTGMDAEVQQRLFEPFFTTKEQGRGLGLAMVYGVVRGHGGAVHVYSEPGQGSTFKVYLPVASRLAEDMALEEAKLVGGSETVLVVDDEEPVQKLLRRILEQGGYTVLLVTNGVEALELYTKLSTEIDLVVLDIIMPQMGGRETYERLREINPEVKVLLSSGYSENGQAQDILAAGARGFLQKPYDLGAVLRKVREVLDG